MEATRGQIVTDQEIIKDIEQAYRRLMVGITKKDTPTCDYYEGILGDAIDELREALEQLEY